MDEVADREWHQAAEVHPRSSAGLIKRRRHLPRVHPDQLRRDIDRVLNSGV